MPDTATGTAGQQTLTVTYAGNGANFDSKTYFPNGMKLQGIKFVSSAANDVLKVRDGSASGPIIAQMKDVAGSGTKDVITNGLRCKPYILLTDQTFGTPENVIVVFELM